MMDEEALEQRLAQLLLVQPSNRLPINQPSPVPCSIDIPEDKVNYTYNSDNTFIIIIPGYEWT